MQNKYCICRVEKCMIKEEIEVNAISHLSEERAGSMGLDTRIHCEIKKGEFKSPQFLIPVNDNIYHSILTILNIKNMVKYDIKVPKECQYLSDWTGFDNELPPGHIILNKSICGCGCTDHYLTNDQPVILLSPRRNLITSKLKNGRTAGKVHYFDRSSGCDLSESIADMENYLCRCGGDPFGGQPLVPKIMVTYDSLVHVVDAMLNHGLLNRFEIVVDEFTCIFTDVKLKGLTEINLLHHLNSLENRIVYISATPLNEAYLDLMGEFKDMPYVTLQWDPSRVETVQVFYSKMRSTTSEVSKIIEDYRANGFFKSKIIDGQQYNSTEAVFFLNSVTDIVSIINKNNLMPSETMVICANEPKNRTALRKVHHAIGVVPNEVEYKSQNKPFTFVTKCAFEGTDFYSDCSTTYVFADSNRDNLCLDISIDLPQIAGRCRSRNNPFRNEIYYFYKDTNLEDSMNERQMIQYYDAKRNATIAKVQQLQQITDPGILDKLKTAQVIDKYTKDYLDVDDYTGTCRAVCNDLAFIADLRAVEIKMMQYRGSYQMLRCMRNNGFNATHQFSQAEHLYKQFCQEFFADANFQRRMKLYIDTVQCYPELLPMIEEASVIPIEFKQYYRGLGAERIRRSGYVESILRKHLEDASKFSSVNITLEQDRVYSNAEIKSMIQAEYNRLGMNATAKATDITKYVPDAVPTRFRDENGKKQNGYKLK